VFYLDEMQIEQLTEVGGSKHLKLRLRRGRQTFHAIFFSMNAVRSAVCEGDVVEVAFTPQINEYRGMRSVQLNLIDIRPCSRTREATRTEFALYHRLSSTDCDRMISPSEAESLTPSREEFVAVWKYIAANASGGHLEEDASCLARKVARCTGLPASPMRTRVCLDVFCERGLIDLNTRRQEVHIRVTADGHKVDLNSSSIMLHLKELSGGD
jgi:single-stranded-DNA-specific exonuclease